MKNISINKQAENIVGKRPTDGLAIDFPAELGFVCPKNGKHSGYLWWSEYNGFLWCEKCNKDYPSCLCTEDLEKATAIYLSAVMDAKNYGTR
jgi:hypothetical protein